MANKFNVSTTYVINLFDKKVDMKRLPLPKVMCVDEVYSKIQGTILFYMQWLSCETLGRMRHKLESRLPGEVSITSDTQITPPLWQKVKKN